MNFLFTVAKRRRSIPLAASRVALQSTGDLGFEHVADGTCVIWQASRADIAHRPMPKLGLSAAEIAEQERDALTWGFETGAVWDIVQAYRVARDRGDSELTAFNEAVAVAQTLGRPLGKVKQTARVLINWAIENSRH